MGAGRRVGLLGGAGLLVITAAVPGMAVSRQSLGGQHGGSPETPTHSVLLMAAPGQDAAALARAGGARVEAELPVAGTVLASIPVGAPAPNGTRVVPDVEFSATSAPLTTVSSQAAAVSAAVSTVRRTLNVPNDPKLGRGVTVALVDTGVAQVPGLSRVKHVNTTSAPDGDGYGHGTFLAGLIAGNASVGGVAPGARILDVKVADDDGTTRLRDLLQGLQVVADDPSVGVLNLSIAADENLDPETDPLSRALADLWYDGVTVVVSAGNAGPGAGTVTSPGDHPSLLTVGALDEAGTGTRSDDTVAAFSGRGSDKSKPDLVAPGVRVISTASPKGKALRENPGSAMGQGTMRGSGTSMATAVASGAAAALLGANPNLSPDAVKGVLNWSAYRNGNLTAAGGAGAGGLDLGAALDEVSSLEDSGSAAPDPSHGAVDPPPPSSSGSGWSAVAYANGSWTTSGWTQEQASGGDPSPCGCGSSTPGAGSPESSPSWTGRSWASRSWASRSWASRSWAGRSWAGDSWAGDSWAGRSWAGRSWAGRSWAGRSWAAEEWANTDRAWAQARWAGQSWDAMRRE